MRAKPARHVFHTRSLTFFTGRRRNDDHHLVLVMRLPDEVDAFAATLRAHLFYANGEFADQNALVFLQEFQFAVTSDGSRIMYTKFRIEEISRGRSFFVQFSLLTRSNIILYARTPSIAVKKHKITLNQQQLEELKKLQELREKLRRLTLCTAEAIDRFWKPVEVFLKKTDLADMADVIHGEDSTEGVTVAHNLDRMLDEPFEIYQINNMTIDEKNLLASKKDLIAALRHCDGNLLGMLRNDESQLSRDLNFCMES